MTETRDLLNNINIKLEEYRTRLIGINSELEDYPDRSESIVVKRISKQIYYYKQWRENKKIHSQLLGHVNPGEVSDHEIRILKRKELLSDKKELCFLIEQLELQRKTILSYLTDNEFETDYDFEVYWKDELSAKVSVKNSRVHVSRYIIHPVKQIFPSESISRNQLNEILKLRCIEEERHDVKDKLKGLGLTSYEPLEIVKKTHGVSFNDFIWFRFPGENISMKDVLVK